MATHSEAELAVAKSPASEVELATKSPAALGGMHLVEVRPPLLRTEAAGLTAYCVLHQIAFLILFSEPGFGDEVYRLLKPLTIIAPIVACAGVCLGALLFLLDVQLWSAAVQPAGFSLGFVAVAAVAAGLVLVVGDYPQAPLVVYVYAAQAGLGLLRRNVYGDCSLPDFLRVVAAVCWLGGCITLVGWILWVAILTGSVWSGATRAKYYALVLCDPTATSCLPAVILYFAPMACGLVNMFVGGSARLLELSLRRRGHTAAWTYLFGGCVVLLVSALYIQASVSGANHELSRSILLFAAAALILIGVMGASAVGIREIAARITAVALVRSLLESAKSDWAKAIGLFGGWAPLALFVFVSVAKQAVRVRLWLPRSLDEWTHPAGEMVVRRGDWLTPAAQAVVQLLRESRLTSLLSKMSWVGIAIMVMDVGFGKLFNVGISYFIEVLIAAGVGAGGVVGIFFAVGLTVLTAVPPAPAFAFYLCGSFLIPRFLPFWTGVLVSIATSFAIKMSHSIIGQKLIGELLGGRVAVRSLVGVNSLTMRAIRKILETPGLTVPKVAILVGGPDWPTCVLTGILKLNLLQMLAGTLPVIVVIAAVTVAGASQLQTNGPWSSASSMTLSLASALMAATLVSAAYFIEETAEKHKAELEALPRDEEVDARDRLAEVRAAAFLDATAWRHDAHPMPLLVRLSLASGALLQVVSVFGAIIFTSTCFVKFQMTDTVGETLLGDWTNLFKPTGRVLMLVWLTSIGQLALFYVWASARTRQFRPAAGAASRASTGSKSELLA